ncbi:MAG: SH3 domain-containing protein [Lachnospiraceae bacterium]|nr:SH3 domain-containing protein [Lachnospiraceae bacterium]
MKQNRRIRLHKDGKVNTKSLKELLFMAIFAVSLLTSDMKILAAEQEPSADTASEQSDEQMSDSQNDAAAGVDISVTTMMYAVKNVNVRKEPNTSSEILGELEAGTNIFAVELTDEGWYRVVYAGETGYIRSDFLEIYSNMDMWVASEPEPVPIDEQTIIATNENADNPAAENMQESAADSGSTATEEEQSSKKNNTLAILIIILLVLIFTYAIIQIVRDNKKSDKGMEDESEDDSESDLTDDESEDSEEDFEIMDLDGK